MKLVRLQAELIRQTTQAAQRGDFTRFKGLHDIQHSKDEDMLQMLAHEFYLYNKRQKKGA